MMQAQKKIDVEDFEQENEEYDVMPPELEAYLTEIEEGREEMFGPFESTDKMWESIFGENWREVVKRC
ncbi:MAG: hypothetical protein IJ575_00980 [Selenomonadaceae bacterium]|nr:hypothetical protein [Selenomonadaceae bacterium]